MTRTRTINKETLRKRRHKRVRKFVSGDENRPRLVVHRSNKNIQAHIVDDYNGRVVLGISSLSKKVMEQAGTGRTKTEVSRVTGRILAEMAKEKGIEKVVFDRGGFLYHGRVKALAEGAREGGLLF